jgi:2'-5' RNA ligase
MENRGNIYEQLEAVLSTLQLGDASSDHRAELQGFSGWNYVAITAVARLATRSLVYVYADRGKPSQIDRKSLRFKYGPEWRKALVREHQGQVLEQEHPLVRLLHRPNPHQSGGSFRWEQIQQMRLHGSCLVLNRPNVARTRTVERYVIPMALVTPIRPGSRRSMPRGGLIVNPNAWRAFVGTNAGGTDAWSGLQQFVNVEIPAEMLSIVKYPHPYYKGDGSSPTNAAAPWIDTSSVIDTNREKFYREGPSGKMLITSGEEDVRRIADLEDRLSRNLSQDGPRVTVVGNGSAVATKLTADEMDYVGGHDQMRDATLAVHGVSKGMVGLQEGMTYGSLAASILASTMLSVQPDMDLIADEETISIACEYGEGVCIEYEVPAVNDPELEESRLQADSKIGVMTVGEYRQKRGEPLFGTEYDNYILTATGPVDPRSIMKPKATVENPMPAMPDPSLVGKSERIIAVDPTLLDEIGEDTVRIVESCGYRMVGFDLDLESPIDAVWDWNIGPDTGALVKSLPPSQERDQLEQAVGQVEQPVHKYGCVLLPLPDELAQMMIEDAGMIPDEAIAAGGREYEPHITALYGLVGCDVDDVVRIVSKMSSPLVKFGKVNAFPAGDDGAPLFVEIDSPDMHRINKTLRSSLPHVSKYPDYNPHATLAYVNDAESLKGTQCGVTGKSAYLTRAIVSMPGMDKVVVPLRRPYEPTVSSGVDPVQALEQQAQAAVEKAMKTLSF